MRFGSVCSGIEAASLAWEPLGWTAAFFSEIERFPSAVLAHRWPHVPNLGDFTKIDGAAWRDQIDVLVGGTPCQAFSVAGQRRSLDDARGNLTLAFVELVHAIDPWAVVWENVPGVLSTPDNAFGCFLSGLVGSDAPLVPPAGLRWTDAGMVAGPSRSAAWRILDAQYVGLAQRRERVFVVSFRAGDGLNPGAVLFEPEGVRRASPPSREAREGVARPVAAGSPGGSGYRNDADTADNLIITVPILEPGRRSGHSTDDPRCGLGVGADGDPMFTLNAERPHGIAVVPTISPALKARDCKGPSSDGDGDGACLVPVVGYDMQNDALTGDLSGTLLAAGAHPPAIAFSCKDHGADAGDVAPTLRSMGHDGSHANAGGQVAIAFKANMSTPSYGHGIRETLQAENPCAVMTGMAVRRLTPRECERLQGMPDGHTLAPYRGKPAADGPRYKAIGNSMAVNVMAWIGRRLGLLRALEVSR